MEVYVSTITQCANFVKTEQFSFQVVLIVFFLCGAVLFFILLLASFTMNRLPQKLYFKMCDFLVDKLGGTK